jgi:hypothetical protein
MQDSLSLSKIGALIASLEELRLHLGRKDLDIGGERVNAQLYFSVANSCLRNRAVLLYGGMGANKTTLVNLLGSSSWAYLLAMWRTSWSQGILSRLRRRL